MTETGSIIKQDSYLREDTTPQGFRLYFDKQQLDYISATTLIGIYEPQEGLEKWRERIGHEEARKITKESAQRGVNSHKELESYFETKKYNEEDAYTKNAVDNFYRYVDLVHSECPVFFKRDKVRFAGRIDQVISVENNTFVETKTGQSVPGGLALADLKTKNKMPRYDIADYIFKNCLQLAAYREAIHQSSDTRVDSSYIVYSTAKSSKILYLDSTKLDFYWKCFKILLLDYYYIKPLRYTWEELVARANVSYDTNTLTYTSMVPSVVTCFPF